MTKTTGFSIIIPTYKEAKNIPELVRRIAAIDFKERPFEVLIVDDNSQDGTENIVAELSANYPWLKLIVRTTKRSLSYSVIEGFQRAHYPLLVTLDADLSHPPEKIPAMLSALLCSDTDLVIGSRYVTHGMIDEVWPWTRKFASWFAAMLARLVTGTAVKDPLSGFLAITKEKCFSGDTLRPIGWKIGLEIIVKCHCKKIIEIPIDFAERRHGYSKLNLKVIFSYLHHVSRLLLYKVLPFRRT